MVKDKVRFEFFNAKELYKFQTKLLGFEREFIYPLDENNNFYISHGKSYSDFFERMGNSRYLLAFDRHHIVGMISMVKKKVNFQGKQHSFFYLADLKVKKDYRGNSISHLFYRKLLSLIPAHSYAWKWSFCYFVGMVGRKGDVSNSFGRSLSARLLRPLTYLKIYFIEPDKLAALSNTGFQPKDRGSRILNLSSAADSKIDSNQYSSLMGVKDIILDDTGKSMKMAHVNLHNLRDFEVVQQLKRLGQISFKNPFDNFCFSLDERRVNLIDYLTKQQIISQSQAHVFSFSLSPKLMKHEFLTLNSDEI